MPKPKAPSPARALAAPARGTSTLIVASVGKAFRVLDAFRGGQRSLGLGEIASATGLDKSAAQRFANTLYVLGYLAKDAISRSYALTPKSLDLGLIYLLGNGVALPAAPYLREAARQSDETVNLTQLDGGDIVYIGRIPSRHIISNDVLVGTRFPAWCTATGRVMLAYMPGDRRNALLERAERIRYTAHTVTSLSQLQALIAKAREDGYSYTAEQIFRGEFTVAAPIFGTGEEPIAAISIAGPASRYQAAEFEKKMVPIVMEAAAAISTTQGRQHRLAGPV
jgi:DNA-binding IclR family transcriptional regulator